MYRKNNAFTLVEIMIVILILAIVAEIVVPQYVQATNNSRQSSLTTDLQSVRNQIELYKAQHSEVYPGTNITAQLLYRTNVAGTTGTDANLFPCGPYLLSIPANPYVAGSAGTTINTGTAAVPGNGTSGWYWQTGAGMFSANDAAHMKL